MATKSKKKPAMRLGKLSELRIDPDNANLHTERGREMEERSIRKRGFGRPTFAAADGTLLGGNQTVEVAADVFGDDPDVVIVETDGDVPIVHVRRDLKTAKSKKARTLALEDNRAAQLSINLSPDVLADEHNRGRLDLTAYYFDSEIRALFGDALLDTLPEEETTDVGKLVDEADKLRRKYGVKPGQLWQLGEHRLLCGDCTSAETVVNVMNSQRAVLFATDPPYLVDYDGTNHPHKWNASAEEKARKNKDWSGKYTDWDASSQGDTLYREFISVAVKHAITDRAAWYCWHASRNQAMLEAIWTEFEAFVHQQIIWVKDRAILTRSWYMWQHEPCFYGWVKGKKPKRTAGDYPPTVWQIPTVAPGEPTDHPTSKPVELFAIPMRQHVARGEICYEPFMGSGSQLIAGEQNGRRVYGIEINPDFVAVTLERWREYTGLDPVLVEPRQRSRKTKGKRPVRHNAKS